MPAADRAGPPLAGLTTRTDAPAAAADHCHRVLAGLGAAIGGPAGSTMASTPTDSFRATDPMPSAAAALPPHTIDLANGLMLAIESLAAALTGVPREVASSAGSDLVLAPAILGGGRWQRPSEPVAVQGGGFVCADVGAADDADRFATLVDLLPPSTTAEQLATEAQQWRLAVTPYRHPAHSAITGPPIFGVNWMERARWMERDRRTSGAANQRQDRDPSAPLTGVTIVDLSIMWAGPLTTRILADLGATVHRIEPTCRLDGMRGDPTGLFEHLARGKQRHDLDLRLTEQRRAFDELVAAADVVLDAFSPRVRPNLGLTRADFAARGSTPITVSIPAFAAGSPMRSWVAYGTGVHAMSGLGFTSPGASSAPHSPPISYPDPIAGLTAALAILALLIERDRGAVRDHVEVPLANAIRPLLGGQP